MHIELEITYISITNANSFVSLVCCVLGVAEEKRQVALTALHNGAKLRQAISRDGHTWTVRIITAQGERSFVYTEGTPVDVTTLDGRTVSVSQTDRYTDRQTD